ncbi:hypothetical protein PpBr36_01404 [Pyricularia pennisetigena]|uniref:hypothetical protein n=1 Tax=Pyricularia pennisetigena TaxID=1578925 RepID=UPI001153C1F9|nr:hypothetical protein PpBr36_01404 [Pyricularia pennisetigena]TLS29048.1 hypothetical protein PpBr36_01404 [Pyricularia pennisetigena]
MGRRTAPVSRSFAVQPWQLYPPAELIGGFGFGGRHRRLIPQAQSHPLKPGRNSSRRQGLLVDDSKTERSNDRSCILCRFLCIGGKTTPKDAHLEPPLQGVVEHLADRGREHVAEVVAHHDRRLDRLPVDLVELDADLADVAAVKVVGCRLPAQRDAQLDGAPALRQPVRHRDHGAPARPRVPHPLRQVAAAGGAGHVARQPHAAVVELLLLRKDRVEGAERRRLAVRAAGAASLGRRRRFGGRFLLLVVVLVARGRKSVLVARSSWDGFR